MSIEPSVDTLAPEQDPGADTPIARMEDLFERRGFAGTSVDELRDAAGVSLRTLYRHYGSREQMIIAALRNRAERYLAYLAGSAGVRELFDRVGNWLEQGQPLGCLFLRARADHPGELAVEQAVSTFHTALHSRLSAAAHADGLPDEMVDELFVLHEGLIATGAALGVPAAKAATTAALDRLLASTHH